MSVIEPISICLATYNGEKFIQRQLDSILPYLERNDEVIISDDSSTDRTVELIESYNDPRIKLFKNQTFRSPVYNFEFALKQATSDYFFLCDQDDEWHPNKIPLIREYLKNYDLVVHDCIVIDESKNIIQESYFKFIKAKKGLLWNIITNRYIGCCMAFRRPILQKCLPFPRNLFMHDWWITLMYETYGKVFLCDQKLISYYRHGSNASTTGFKSPRTLSQKLKIRFTLIINFVKRIIFAI